MDDDQFNMSMRKFLKEVGVTSQREIERIARAAAVDATALHVKMILTADDTELCHIVEGEIALEGEQRILPARTPRDVDNKPGPAVIRQRGASSK